MIFAIGFAVSLFPGSGEATAQSLPETVTGKAQLYDGVTFDLMHDGGRYRAATRVRLEAVDACELRQKARHADVDWPCGAVATAWLASRTLVKEVECRPTRVLSGGGYRALCYVDGTDIAAAGLGQGMYVLAAPEQEYTPPGYAEIEARAKATSAGIWSSEFMMPAQWRRAHGTYNPLAPQR
ncbi:hypothetical protein [Pseudaminobacter sp. NGMCC 1.201702]|uniref:hypothetical protein n=1 Tax=Pseudaminobacter sp. NGMCC 1.201702 TaxID=3391825 RepID=UPI0039EDF4CE